MGLRERNAARTRQVIFAAAMELFGRDGYEETTMEEIAQQADIGSSTLYRYFLNKESIVMEPLGDPGVMAAEVARRPADEDVAVVVGKAILALLELQASLEVHARLKEMLTENPKPFARVLEWFRDEERLLEQALLKRTGAAPDDLHIAFTARVATVILSLTFRTPEGSDEVLDPAKTARQIMLQLHGSPPTLPYVP
ncbi:MAG TPA: helix-turn-helix domain-containing protein [Kribbella sp.]|uniref:TetR/AcrR family transcriptional regulator n=1 Tax=Kribbella sp. TaxID=1871183 RepID=UPI002D79CEE2|nr:helix-turn-helix domain-containing protein [Kribbella sp.]HET6294019.1 helix-turn-helix domain-containing protein [Kribbella sp.]